MIPRFALIIGSMKSGTTSLFEYLCQHPSVARPSQKEPNFFASDENWSRGIYWYESLWDWKPDQHQIALEATANYTKLPHFPNAAEQIEKLDRSFKFIYIMRDPIARLESHLTHAMAVGWIEPGQSVWQYQDAINVSRYAMQLRPYYERFDPEDIHLLRFEDLTDDPASVTREIFEFLEIEPQMSLDADTVHNRSSTRRREHPLWLKLRSVDVLERIGTMLVPANMRRAVRQMISKPPERVCLTDEERAFVADEIGDDMVALASEFGVDTSRWEI